MTAKQEPRSRSLDQSIWRDLHEDVFRKHLVKLEERTNAVPISPVAFVAADWRSQSSRTSQTTHSLSIEVEQQLADDFACLVAVEEGAQSVAAVCVEEQTTSCGITLRFAALDVSVNDSIKSALESWSVILSDVATCDDVQYPEYVDVFFTSVVKLHFRRLLARLRSSKWEKPKYLSRTHKKPLWQDFDNLIHRAQFAYAKKDKSAKLKVEALVKDLAAIYRGFEEVAKEDELVHLERLVRASFIFSSTPAVYDYLNRLESGAGPTPTTQVAAAIKSLRQIQKIAALRRIPITLANTAHQYPSLFAGGITVACLTPFAGVPTTIGYEEWATTCHVHAEVQLAVHYDLCLQSKMQSGLSPRAIGISKSLCYLCYQFLRAHGRFFPSRTHGRLYDQWTVPDLAEFDDDTAERYRDILKRMDDEVVRHTELEPELWRAEPMTSIDVYSGVETSSMVNHDSQIT
ncbi:Hypothetical protein R9X50_00184000 [Acrodontium crateriforme]|uniref:Uncharacterized protein n=1 Tax=Acrodontium crateriforme TaxID=150365 RepID=A0AAQ3M353_9PEZI|nr:Hypothetical protein R9X50_00184000 [Acrodontium crateriforme]